MEEYFNPEDLESQDVEIEYDSLDLTDIEYRFKKYFSNECFNLHDRNIKVEIDRMAHEFAIELKTRFIGERKNIVIKYPKDWWESFKERWFPDFLLKRFPVKYEKEEVTIDRIFPDLPLSEDRIGRIFYVTKMK